MSLTTAAIKLMIPSWVNTQTNMLAVHEAVEGYYQALKKVPSKASSFSFGQPSAALIEQSNLNLTSMVFGGAGNHRNIDEVKIDAWNFYLSKKAWGRTLKFRLKSLDKPNSSVFGIRPEDSWVRAFQPRYGAEEMREILYVLSDPSDTAVLAWHHERGK